MTNERSQNPKTGKTDGKSRPDPFGPSDVDPFGPSDPSDPFSLSGQAAYGIDENPGVDNEHGFVDDNLSQGLSVDSLSLGTGLLPVNVSEPTADESISESTSLSSDDGLRDENIKAVKKGRLVRKRRRRSYALGSTITLRDLYETVTSITFGDIVFFLKNQIYNWLAFALMAAIASLVIKFNC